MISKAIFRRFFNFAVAKVSKKDIRYSFEAVSVQKTHPIRQLSEGTDRIVITPNLLILTDHGAGTL